MLKRLAKLPPGLEVPVENRKELFKKTGRPVYHTPPAMDHYPHVYKHDSDYMAMVYARHDDPRRAKEEIYTLFEGMDPATGFIPNMRFTSTRFYDPEPLTFMNPRLQSDYTQPPLEAKAVAETFDACMRLGFEGEGRFFLEDIYPKLKKSYEYFINYRQNSADDPLIGIIHPHETGRDSDPTFDFIKWRPTRNGPDTPQWKDLVGSVMDYAGAYTLNVKNRIKSWDVNKIFEHFRVDDIMFNYMYADNLGTLANIADYLGKIEDAEKFQALSAKVFDTAGAKMWDPHARDGDGAFYALDAHGDKIKNPEPIHVVSVSNLFPLLNPNLPENQLISLIKLQRKAFNTRFQQPTVATDEPGYDPEYQGKGIMWRGSVWLWMNDGTAEGWERQARRADISPLLQVECAMIAAKIRLDSYDLCQDQREHNSPNTGEGQRVRGFAGKSIGRLAARESILIAA